MYDAIVIGGGIVGASAAYHLVCDGAKTLLIDRADTGWATNAGAGILAPAVGGIGIDPVWFDFAVEAVGYYPALVEQLQARQDEETGYAVCGMLTVAVTEDEVEPYERKKQEIEARQASLGVPGAGAISEISSGEAQALFPALAPVRRALYYRDAARVDGKMITGAMQVAARHHKLVEKHASADQLIIDSGKMTGVIANGERIAAGKFVIAGGAWSQMFGDQLGVQIAVEPQRGQIAHLHLPETETGRWPIVEAFHGHYIVCWPDNRVVTGATREIGSGFKPYTTVTGVREVMDEALRVAPGLCDAQVKEIRVGLRPYTQDHLPVLGTVPNVEGVFLATGHGPTGLQLGPYSGKLAADWVLGKTIETDISAFSVNRFD
jgi:D-amino-acid dehydrogenase